MPELATSQDARRTNSDTGIQEIAEFRRVGGGSIFGFAHVPARTLSSAVVFCSSLYAEFIRNYRREVTIARALAELGIASYRFHYRGQGNSVGEGGATTFESMVEDGSAATERIRELTSVDRMAFAGCRLGSLVAATLASDESAPLCLWDPVLAGVDYFDGILRARRILDLKNHGSRVVGDGDDPATDTLERSNDIPVLGYTISRTLVDSSRGKRLEHLLGRSPRPILVVRMGKRANADQSLEQVVRGWRGQGFEVEEVVTAREPWWFSSGDAIASETADDAVRSTVQWFARALGA